MKIDKKYSPGALLLLLALSILALPLKSQSVITGLKGGETFDSMVLAISKPLYNLQFDETLEKINDLKKIIPEHPVVDLLYAINITWQTIPEPLPDNFEEIKMHLESSLAKARAWLQQDKDNPEATFFLLMSHGLLAQYYNEQGSPFKTMSEAKRAYNAIMDSFELKDDYNEFLFSCGLYNYYRERYPQLYPVYKPFIWLFRKGSIEDGLEQLESARRVTILSRVESAHYLAYIYLRYELKPVKAISILVPLVFEFPGNLYFKTLLLESYMMVGNLDTVAGMIEDLTNAESRYFKLCGNTFKGVLKETYEDNDVIAKRYYQNALTISESYEVKNINALAVAYAGLARINYRDNNVNEAKEYYKLAAKYTRTESIRKEAKEFLRSH